jgi:outer membrane protein assembly factor BamB
VATGWTTYHHDNSRNGFDPNAPAFSGGPFSSWTKPVDFSIYAEPLAFNGSVYVATLGNSIYSFNASTGTQVWARTAIVPPSTSSYCSFNPGHIGILGTPVIDPIGGILYAVTLSSSQAYQLWGLNLADGTTASGFPVALSVSPSGQNQRASLALANGHIYVPFGGWLGDCGTYHPNIVSVPTSGGAQDHQYQPQTGCQNGAGMWGPSGLAVDSSGWLYAATGNGTNNGVSCIGNPSYPCTNSSWDHSNGVLKISGTLGENDYWTPDNATQSWCALSVSDTDIGSIGPALLPNGEVFQTGKPGYGWLLSTSSLGHFDGQQFQAQIGTCHPEATFGGLAYYAGRIYVPCDGVGLVAFSVDTVNHTFSSTPDWVQAVDPGPPIAAMGLIWARDQGGNNLYGFDPVSGTKRVQVALGGGSNHFGSLAEDAGWVFVEHGANINAYNFNASPCGSTSSPHWFANCSYLQYALTGSNGATWTDMDATNLSISFTPSVASYAVLTANSSLWTSTAGVNQDLGIAVSGGSFPSITGQPEAWKESGGVSNPNAQPSGTFSPNAAYLQTVIPVAASTTYTARLQWKSNKANTGTIWAGAGPISSTYSPTRITATLVPTAAGTVFSASSTSQYSLAGSNGATWQDMDGTNLSLPFTPPTGSWTAYVSANGDLWTSSPGYNQDLGVTLTGGGYPSVSGQPEAWKESGGPAGFSPNAAFLQAPLAVAGGTAYTARLQWKTNKPDAGTVYAGAGPVSAKFSPTSIAVVLVPSSTGGLSSSSTQQYSLSNSNGSTWQSIDMTNLSLTITPSAATNYDLSANLDLWTNTLGYGQDIGVMISGGAFGAGMLATWEESGSTGTFSPNAAFAHGDVALAASTAYTVWLVWKTNRAANAVTIYAGAGPINTKFSPTFLTATTLN